MNRDFIEKALLISLLIFIFLGITGQKILNLSSYEKSLIQRAEQAFSEEKQRIFLDSLRHPVCATPLMVEIRTGWDKVSQDAKKILAQFTDRPDYGEHTEYTHDSPSGRFKIHYTITGEASVYQSDVDENQDGVPDYVNECARILDNVWAKEIDTLGYDPPPSDSYYLPEWDNGGDGKYDVYLDNLPTDFFGASYPERQVEKTAPIFTSYMMLRNDYSYWVPDFYRNVYEPLKVTAAHEFFHAIHFGYDATEAEVEADTSYKPYWMEICAVWMEDMVYDDINDYLGYLPAFYNYPWLSLRTFRSIYDYHPYASCVWAFFLSENYGTEIIKKIWEKCAEIPGDNVLEATDEILQQHPYSTTFEDAFREFTVWNYFTADRARTNLFYSEGDLFYDYSGNPIHVTVDNIHFRYPVEEDAVSKPPENLGSSYVVFDPDTSRGGLRIEFDGEAGDWEVSALGYNPIYLSPLIVEFLVNPSNQYGLAEVYNWNLYSEIVMVSAVVTKSANTFFPYIYSAIYDSSLHGELPTFEKDIMGQNFPNPFIIKDSDYTHFPFTLSVPSRVRIDIFTANGELIKTIHPKQVYPIGEYFDKKLALAWDGKNEFGDYVTSGVYLYHVKTENGSALKKMVVIR